MRDKSLGEAHDSYQSMHEVSSQITPLLHAYSDNYRVLPLDFCLSSVVSPCCIVISWQWCNLA